MAHNKTSITQVIMYQDGKVVDISYSVEIPGEDAVINAVSWSKLKEIQQTINDFVKYIEDEKIPHIFKEEEED